MLRELPTAPAELSGSEHSIENAGHPGFLGCLRDNESMAEAVIRDPEIMHGTPVFRGTRVPLQTLFDYLEGGETLEDFLEGFPTVSRELAIQAFEEAKVLLLSRP